MTNTAPGLELFLSTDKAVEGANKFRDAVESALQAIERIGQSVDRIGAGFDKFGDETAQAAAGNKLVERSAIDTTKQLRTEGDAADFAAKALAQMKQSIAATTAAQAGLAVSSRAAGTALRTQDIGAAALDFGSVAGAIGGAGAAMRALSVVARAVPFAGVAALALDMAGAFGSSSDAIGQTIDRFRELQDAARNAKDVAQRIDEIRRSFVQGDKGAGDSLIRSVRDQLIELQELSQSGASQAPADLVLGAIQQQAPETVAALRRVMAEMLELGKTGKPATQELREQFRELGQVVLDRFGVKIEGTGEKLAGVFGSAGTATKAFLVDTREGLNAVGGALDRLVGQAGAARDALKGADVARLQLQRGGVASTADDGPPKKAAAAERERVDAIREFLAEKLRENELIGRTREEYESVRLVQEAQVAAQKAGRLLRLEEFAQLGAIISQRREVAADKSEEKRAQAVAEVLRSLRDENALLEQQGPARAALAKSQQIANLLARQKVATTAEEAAELQLQLDLNRQLLELDQKRVGLTIVDRKADFLKQFDDEAALLGKVGKDREQYQTQLQIENEARQQGFELSKQEITDLTKRRIATKELAEAQEAAAEAGRQFGQSFSSAIENLVFDMERGRDVAKAFAQDLARLAFRQTVGASTQQLFALAGQKFANLFAPGAAPQSGPNSPTGRAGLVNQSSINGGNNYLSGGFMTGGVIPAMNGQVVDEFGFLRRGGRTYSFAEGGKSTPEAIVPLERMQDGRLGVASAGGGGATNVSMSFPNVRTAADARAMRATLGQRVRQMLEADNRGRRGLRPRGQ